MKRHICPRCHGARMILQADRYSDSQRRYCPLCGETQWLNFDLRRPSRAEIGGLIGAVKRQSMSAVMREGRKSA